MGMDSYPQEISGFMKLLKRKKIGEQKDRKLGKTPMKKQTVVAFTQTHEKDVNDKKKQVIIPIFPLRETRSLGSGMS